MDSAEKVFSKKNIIYLLLLLIVAVAIPVGVKLVQEQQILRSQAAGSGEIKILDKGDVVKCSGNVCTTTEPRVEVEIKAPSDL